MSDKFIQRTANIFERKVDVGKFHDISKNPIEKLRETFAKKFHDGFFLKKTEESLQKLFGKKNENIGGCDFFY